MDSKQTPAALQEVASYNKLALERSCSLLICPELVAIVLRKNLVSSFAIKIYSCELGMVVSVYNPNTQESQQEDQ
jgi:hypothetical protein